MVFGMSPSAEVVCTGRRKLAAEVAVGSDVWFASPKHMNPREPIQLRKAAKFASGWLQSLCLVSLTRQDQKEVCQ